MSVSLDQIQIRALKKEDNAELAQLIRATLKEFGANHPGTVYYDEATDHLFEVFAAEPRSFYQVAVLNGRIVGGAGIYPTEGLPHDTCELVKMYLYPEVRGLGLGKKLINNCLDFAAAKNYHYVYLETMPELKQALKTYARFGFEYIDKPMGNSGHFGCDLFMLKKLS